MPGQLLTNYFLEEGIHHTDAWQESLSQPHDRESFRAHALSLFDEAANFHTVNEAYTEVELIRPSSIYSVGTTTCPGRVATTTQTSQIICS